MDIVKINKSNVLAKRTILLRKMLKVLEDEKKTPREKVGIISRLVGNLEDEDKELMKKISNDYFQSISHFLRVRIEDLKTEIKQMTE